MKSINIDIGEIFFAAVVIWMMVKGELMGVIALCAFAAVLELSRIRKMIKKREDEEAFRFDTLVSSGGSRIGK